MSGAELLDLDALVQNDTGEFVVKHPATGEATMARITIAGPEHPKRRALVFARMRQARRDFEKTGAIAVTDPEDDEADANALFAACTLGWSGINQGGAPLAWSAEAAARLMADPKYRWLRDQVRDALDKRELFIAASAQA